MNNQNDPTAIGRGSEFPYTKTLYTLCVDDYAPQITAITFPLLQHYAEKIGAKFHIIKERKFPHLPPVMEKMQIWELAQGECKADWHIFFDADALIHPEMWDLTALMNKDTTCSGSVSDFTPVRFRPDKYFLRDGRFIGKGNWCLIASDWCLDIWHPLDISVEEAIGNINLTVAEVRSGVMKPEHLIDDYVVSRNIARFGLKHVLLSQLANQVATGHGQYQHDASGYVWHQYLHDVDKKAEMMKQQLNAWGLALTPPQPIHTIGYVEPVSTEVFEPAEVAPCVP